MRTSAWPVWGLDAEVTVTEPDAIQAAETLVRACVDGIDQACSRFRPDSELALLQPVLGRGTRVSPLLMLLVEKALEAADLTGGDVDPTLGRDLEALGYDRDIRSIQLLPTAGPARSASSAETVRPGGHNAPASQRVPGWQRIVLDGRTLQVPEDLRLDLGASAKAVAVDMAAVRVADELGCGALVSIGGDLASAGPAPVGGWQILVQDLPADPAQQVGLVAGYAMATSSTQKRRWQHHGRTVHHILDPRFGLPADPVWRSVSVAAATCLEANAYSTAAVVRGFSAVEWFRSRGVTGRLVDRQGRVVVAGAWPAQLPETRTTTAAAAVSAHG